MGASRDPQADPRTRRGLGKLADVFNDLERDGVLVQVGSGPGRRWVINVTNQIPTRGSGMMMDDPDDDEIDLSIPGPPGIRGEKGDQGDTGPQGPPGEGGGGGGGGGESIYFADLIPETPHANDDEFNTGALDTGVWSVLDNDATQTESVGSYGLLLTKVGTAGDSESGIFRSVPVGDFSVVTKVQLGGKYTNYTNAGMFIAEDLVANPTTADMRTFSLYYQTDNGSGAHARVLRWSSYNTFTGESSRIGTGLDGRHLYLRIRRISTTYYYDISGDGLAWVNLHSEASPFTVAHIGLQINNIFHVGQDDAFAYFRFWRQQATTNLNEPLLGKFSGIQGIDGADGRAGPPGQDGEEGEESLWVIPGPPGPQGPSGAGTLDIVGLASGDPALPDEIPYYSIPGAVNRKATVARLGGLLARDVCGGRLTLTTGTPVVASVTSGGTIYYTPYTSNQIALYDGTRWLLFHFSELSLVLSGLTADRNYDVFAYSNSGTPTLELSSAWNSNGVTRTDALTRQDGILVKSGVATRRFLGTVRTTGVNVVDDRPAKRFVNNFYNRVPRNLFNAPGYNNNDTADTLNISSTVASSVTVDGTGTVEFVLCEPGVYTGSAKLAFTPGSGQSMRVGFGVDDGGSFKVVSSGSDDAIVQDSSMSHTDQLVAGWHFLILLARVSGGTGTITTDSTRTGSIADPYRTLISGNIFG